MTNSITTASRPARVGGDQHDPFATIPGAYGDDGTSWREHVHDYTSGSCCGRTAPSWVSSDVLGLLDNAEEV